jgi:hypothetical protein
MQQITVDPQTATGVVVKTADTMTAAIARTTEASAQPVSEEPVPASVVLS